MFDGFFKPRFSRKCKSLIKLAKVRLEAVGRKKNAVCKYLKKDIADLLKNGLDYNAYGRTEGLLDEKKRLSCYDCVERFYDCVASNVSLMQKSRECPEECREAVSSLIYAAARISEVPELRDLRSLFTERYGNSLEPFVNQEFVGKFKVRHPSKEMKLELMHDIAKEFSIEWNTKSLEQKLYRPPPTEMIEKNDGPTDDEVDDGYERQHKSGEERSKGNAVAHEKGSELKFHARKASIDDKNKFFSSSEDESIKTRENSERDSLRASSSSIGSISEDEQETRKPFYYRFIPAPYTKPIVAKDESIPEENTTPKSSADNISKEEKGPNQEVGSTIEAKPKPRSVRRRFANPPPANIEVSKVEPSNSKQEEMKNNFGFKLADDKREDSLYPLKRPPSMQAVSRKHWKCDSMGQAELMNDNVSSEGRRRHARTSSWQPEVSSNQGHSPELPDFDELASRVAALRR